MADVAFLCLYDPKTCALATPFICFQKRPTPSPHHLCYSSQLPSRGPTMKSQLTHTCHPSKFLFVFPAYMTLSHVPVPQRLLPSLLECPLLLATSYGSSNPQLRSCHLPPGSAELPHTEWDLSRIPICYHTETMFHTCFPAGSVLPSHFCIDNVWHLVSARSCSLSAQPSSHIPLTEDKPSCLSQLSLKWSQ